MPGTPRTGSAGSPGLVTGGWRGLGSPPGPSLCWELLSGETALLCSLEPGTSSGRGSSAYLRDALLTWPRTSGSLTAERLSRPSQAAAPLVAPTASTVGFGWLLHATRGRAVSFHPTSCWARSTGGWVCSSWTRAGAEPGPRGPGSQPRAPARLALLQFLP